MFSNIYLGRLMEGVGGGEQTGAMMILELGGGGWYSAESGAREADF